MFLRQTRRKKDGKTHTYWSVVENQRLQGGRVVQRHVLYLGEISPSQAAAWRKSIEVFDEEAGQPRTLALFPEDRCAAAAPDSSVVQLRLSEMRLCRPRNRDKTPGTGVGQAGWPRQRMTSARRGTTGALGTPSRAPR